MKMFRTGLLTALVIMAGCAWQWQYNRDRARVEAAVTGFYRQYLGREPDPNGLRHWVRWAQDRWGLERVEREGFAGASERGAT